MIIFVFGTIENIVGKVEKAGFHNVVKTLDCVVQCKYCVQHFSYIAVASEPIHAFLEILLPGFCTVIFQSHWLLSHMNILETMISGEIETRPVAMTIINPQGIKTHAGDSNQWLTGYRINYCKYIVKGT